MSSRISPFDPIPSDPIPSGLASPAAAKSHRVKPCAVCAKPQAEAFRPFCSRRCADVDLHRWLSGAYALPALKDDGGDAGPAESGER
jgi:endogenous inhibitor of DNA gyrase (YacG/DUF329 family)